MCTIRRSSHPALPLSSVMASCRLVRAGRLWALSSALGFSISKYVAIRIRSVESFETDSVAQGLLRNRGVQCKLPRALLEAFVLSRNRPRGGFEALKLAHLEPKAHVHPP